MNDSKPLRKLLNVRIETGKAPDAIWVHVRGEADVSNHRDLRAGLLQVRLDGVETVHLELAQLTFCDVRAFRELVTFARNAEQAGHTITIHGASHMVRKMTDVCGLGQQLSFQ